MLCEKCKIREAHVTVQNMKNGVTETHHYCEACAKTLQIMGPNGENMGTFGQALLNFLQDAIKKSAADLNKKPEEEKNVPNTDLFNQVLAFSKALSKELGGKSVGTEHLLLALLRVHEGGAYEILKGYGVTEQKVADMIKRHLVQGYAVMELADSEYTPLASEVLKQAQGQARRANLPEIGTEYFLLTMLQFPTCQACKILASLGVTLGDLRTDLLTLLRTGNIPVRRRTNGKTGRDNTTSFLNQYGHDLTEEAAEHKIDPVVGRKSEMDRVIQILSRRTKNNPCLIGEPGVGKTAVVEGLAQMIAENRVPDMMKGKRLLSLDLGAMVAGTKFRGEFEERIKNVIREVEENKNVILFIVEIHTIIGAGGAEGSLDAANIIKPELSRGRIQLIGATTISEYRKHIEKDAALERRFQPVTVTEPSEEESIEILKGLRKAYETHHEVMITDQALVDAVKLSKRYITDRFLPDKAIDVIDEASSKVHLQSFTMPKNLLKLNEQIAAMEKEKEDAYFSSDIALGDEIEKKQSRLIVKLEKQKAEWEEEKKKNLPEVTEETVAEVLSAWTKIPLSSIKESEASRLRNLEETLHKRVIGQTEAVSAVSRAIRRGRVGLKSPNRPIGSFLFLGPTGVGKTELSKTLAEAMFGTENAMIRVDMSEYMEKHSVSKMVGSPPGYVGFDEGGQLSEKVRRNPYAVILFDEIEKAHPDVFNILLQVLDDGQITDSQGRTVDFKNTVIIMTSNLGATEIIAPKNLGFGSKTDENADYAKMKERVMDEVKRAFKPEFLNRIDEMLVFHPLTKTDMEKIVTILLRNVAKTAKETLGIRLIFQKTAKEAILEKGYDPKFGARPLRRSIQELLEDPLSLLVLEGKFGSGDTVNVGRNKNGLSFTRKEK